MDKNNIWEQRYRELKNIWGIESEATLIKYESLVSKGKILDLGVGEGRNVIKFALKDYEIEGVDISQTALERCDEFLEKIKCSYNLLCTNLLNYNIKPNTYSLVISTWVLNFFKKTEGLKLIEVMKEGLVKDGIIYIGVFSKVDPRYAFYKGSKDEIEKDTFYIEERNSYVTYYDKEELLNLFSEEYEIICCKEECSLDLGHGDKHHHGVIEIMMRKR